MTDSQRPDATSNDELLALLRPHASRVDGVPPRANSLGRQAFSARPSDAGSTDFALATLVSDSVDSDAVPVGVRSTNSMRSVVFDLGEDARLTLEFSGRRLAGHVDSTSLVAVSCNTPVTSQPADRLDDNTFQVEPCPSGPFCLVVRVADREVVTDWMLHS